MRAPQPEAPVERVERREREVDRRRGRAPLDLQPAPKVPGGVIARQRIGQRSDGDKEQLAAARADHDRN
jgi:hypothetical protein